MRSLHPWNKRWGIWIASFSSSYETLSNAAVLVLYIIAVIRAICLVNDNLPSQKNIKFVFSSSLAKVNKNYMVLIFVSTTYSLLRALFYFSIPLFLFTNRKKSHCKCEKVRYFIVIILFALYDKNGDYLHFKFTCNIKLQRNRNYLVSDFTHIPSFSIKSIFVYW